jgi:hypothetical protein
VTAYRVSARGIESHGSLNVAKAVGYDAAKRTMIFARSHSAMPQQG